MKQLLRRIAWLTCWILLFASTGRATAIVPVETDHPKNCAVCHLSLKALPDKHIKVVEKTDCFGCHDRAKQNLIGRLGLAHLHLFRDVSCSDCHAEKPFARVGTDTCLGCHDSFETVVQNTASMEHNPHGSPHYGTEVDCDMCHHMHTKSENLCQQCHDWETPVP